MRNMEKEIQAKINSIIGKLSSLPTLPLVLEKINQLMKNPKTSASDIARIIGEDQSLAAKTLRIANSPFYACPCRITTVSHAIVILGFAAVRNIVLTTSIFDIFEKGGGEKSFPYESFWEHSLACGVASKIIARTLNIKEVEEAFLGGLLHDIGKIVLEQYLHEEFMTVLEFVNKEDIFMNEAEKKILGVDHSLIGATLAQRWNFPPVLQNPIKYHHNPNLAPYEKPMVYIVHVANIFVKALGIGLSGDEKVPIINREAWDFLGFNLIKTKRLFTQIDEEFEEAKVFLE